MSDNRGYVVAIVGKGGVGKTSLTALLLDELARRNVASPLLAVDGDPAATLYLALGLSEPAATLASVRDTIRLDARTIRSLPVGFTPADYVNDQLNTAGVIGQHRLRGWPLHLLTMGQGEGPGCYCAINQALSVVLDNLMERFALIIVDCEAGLEHLSRYRLKHVDLFLVVTTPSPAAKAVARRILQTASEVGMAVETSGVIFNRADDGGVTGILDNVLVTLPESSAMASLERNSLPITKLPDDDPIRQALQLVMEKIESALHTV